MTLPWPLAQENTLKLAPMPTLVPVPSAAPQPSLKARLARRAARTRIGQVTRDNATAIVERLIAAHVEREQSLEGEIHDLRVQLQRLGQAPNWYQEGLRRDTNLELLKAEVRSLERSLLELGMQLAPATGLAGVGARIGELREQVNAVSRHAKQLDLAVARLAGPAPQAVVDDATPVDAREARDAASVVAGHPPSTTPSGDLEALFDYVAFESRFRGAPDDILAIQRERYAELLTRHAPVLDWGCGRGELLELLASDGVDVIGVEIDSGMVSEARSRGLTVHQQDAVSYLMTCEPDSLGAVFSAHVAEHIPFDALMEVIHASLRALRPGGIFVAETPNPTSLIVPSNSFILDPTHLRPIHPSLFAFACETAGFRDVRLTFHSPATSYQLAHTPDDGSATAPAFNAAVDRLNDVLFGPQEYAVVATKAPRAEA